MSDHRPAPHIRTISIRRENGGCSESDHPAWNPIRLTLLISNASPRFLKRSSTEDPLQASPYRDLGASGRSSSARLSSRSQRRDREAHRSGQSQSAPCLTMPGEGLARILVGGAEYYANVDPRVPIRRLKIGTQILVNEAYAVIKTLGYDRNGPVLKVAESLPMDGFGSNRTWDDRSLILQRSSDLVGVDSEGRRRGADRSQAPCCHRKVGGPQSQVALAR